MAQEYNDEFELYDLSVEVVGDKDTFVCSHQLGHAFDVLGENLSFDNSHHRQFSFYSLAGLLPLLAAKQRPTDSNDWMTSDELIACPDRNCGAQFSIKRIRTRKLRHSEVTKEPRKNEGKT